MNVAKDLPSVSFIIPTYNASVHIESCLMSIRGQDYPRDKVEVLISDGGSGDNTLELAKKYDCRIIYNPKRLAEYGVQIGVEKAIGEFLVVFAADNELVGNDWLRKVINVFYNDKDISAVWGRLESGKDDTALNKYFALIQSDPLNWFLNQNLSKYMRRAIKRNGDCFIFYVNPSIPLVWGANGLSYRTARIRGIWAQGGYLGDNDAFQYMVEQGNNKVAYFRTPFVYHHHVAKLGDWVKKWQRNFRSHLLDKQKTRNMNWVFTGNFKIKLALWVIYSSIPIFSFLHSVYLIFRDRKIHWLYHPICCFLQTGVYGWLVFASPKSSLKLVLAQNKNQ
jgi:glycosyltransferase involved in cell wall biosynthesis